MLKKELVIYTETNEEGEFVKINRLDTDPGFFLLTLGQNRMVVNGGELIEALQTIDHYGTLFDQELKMKQQRAAAPPFHLCDIKKMQAHAAPGRNQCRRQSSRASKPKARDSRFGCMAALSPRAARSFANDKGGAQGT